MQVAQVVLELGGIADSAVLVAATSKHQLHQAVRSGSVVRLGRGRYALPDIDEHPRAAASLNGALHLLSAARHHGWKVRMPPPRPQVLVPRGRNVSASRRDGVDLRWGSVTEQELHERVTTPVKTVLECARLLPLEDALAVADSAMRAGMSRTTLLLAAGKLPRVGQRRAYRVIELADGRAANPFESATRAILCDIPGVCFEPQVWIGDIGRADLVDRRRKIAVECDSFEFHSNATALDRDMVRYNAFVCADHLVLRFGWKHAMFEQDYVRHSVTGVVAAQERSTRRCPTCVAA